MSTLPTPGTMDARCPHCGAPVEAMADEFCCKGCEVANAIIRGAGLERYYEERDQYAPRPRPMRTGWKSVPVHVDRRGMASISLMIDNLRCASCVWVCERVLEHEDGVEGATVSYATGRTGLTWDPARTDLESLAARIQALGYRPRLLGEEAKPDRPLLLRLGVAAFASMNIMLLYVSLYAGWMSGMEADFTVFFNWAALLLATPVAVWCAGPFFAGAMAGLRERALHMDLPIAIAVAILYGHGVVTTLTGGDAYLDSLAMLVTLLLAGRVLESRGRRRASEAAVSLAASAPATARRRIDDGVREVPAGDLVVGDLVDVGAGEEVAADGVVVFGGALVQRALLTGEAEPVEILEGGEVVAGLIVLSGALTFRVEAAGAETVLSRMADELRASADRSTLATATDRIAPWFTAATLVVATTTFVGWALATDVARALPVTVAVLVVACPCALALSRPLTAAAALGAIARRGLLFRSVDGLLALRHVDLVALDKTGTVTEGDLAVLDATDETLRIAAGLERYSAHPVARAITNEATHRGIPLPRAADVSEEAGLGISGRVDDRRWQLAGGGPGRIELRDMTDDTLVGAILLGDQVRADSEPAVSALLDAGLDVALLTGDHEDVGTRIASKAGIPTAVCNMRPDEKVEWIDRRRGEGRNVLFVGDGLNDGPALAKADVGVAMGTGAASSVLVADGVIAGGSLRPIATAIAASHISHSVMRASQRRSIMYNVLAVSAAAAGLVNPLVAAVLMPLSSTMVIWNASTIEARLLRCDDTSDPAIDDGPGFRRHALANDGASRSSQREVAA